MLKKDCLQSEFETIVKRCVSSGVFSCCLGVKKLHHLTIAVVRPFTNRSYIALRAYYNPSDFFVLARSYPMSYSSAYSLVCSL